MPRKYALVEFAELYNIAHKDIPAKHSVGHPQYWQNDSTMMERNQNTTYLYNEERHR